MSLSLVLIISTVAASALLLFRSKSRLFPLIALVASGLQALAAYNILRVESGVISLSLVFGVAILIAGGVLWMEKKERIQVSAATVLVMVGLIQTLQGVGVI